MSLSDVSIAVGTPGIRSISVDLDWDAEKFAMKTLASVGWIPRQAPYDMDELAAKLGFRVHRVEQAEIGGALAASYGKTIWLAKLSNVNRMRLNLAHEIVHLRLGVPHNGDHATESLVNRRAGALLMPSYRVFPIDADKGIDIPALAARFQVSYEVALRRMVELLPSVGAMWDSPADFRYPLSFFVSNEDEEVMACVGSAVKIAWWKNYARDRVGVEGSPKEWRVEAWATRGGRRSVGFAYRPFLLPPF